MPDQELATVDEQQPLVDVVEDDSSASHDHLGPALEALLLVADEPLTETTMAQVLEAPVSAVRTALGQLVDFYDETGRGFELRALAGGWRFYTREEHADLVGRFVLEGQQAKLSQAALETLSVVAYLQPVSRARISGVRGVSVDGVMRTLLTRELITEVGVDEHSGATLFGTTDYFCERMGLNSLDELPPLAPHLPEVEELEAELTQLSLVPEPSESAVESAPENQLENQPENEPDSEAEEEETTT